MSGLSKISAFVCALLLGGVLHAQNEGYAVFVPISKYISQGDANKLSAWFADDLEISIISSTNYSSKNQARQILKSFFETHSPRSFTISDTASGTNMKYAYGTLNAGGEAWQVTIFVNLKGGGYQIQQLKIERRTSLY